MTKEEKQLLLKDLCARLPYGVKINIKSDYTREMEDTELTPYHLDGLGYNAEYRNLRPYLRPMSSMTEEEREEFNALFNGTFQYFNQGIISASHLWDRNEAVFVGELDCVKLIDWLNKKGFDYRGLIPMGLALEAKEGMYKTE